MQRSWEQMRAQDAFDKITRVSYLQEAVQSRYVSYAKGLPASIISNGVGQAAATLQAAASAKTKEEDPHMMLYRHLESWLCSQDERAPYPNQKNLMKAIVSGSQAQYRWAQQESMAWLVWIKKFAVAYLSSGDTREEGIQ